MGGETLSITIGPYRLDNPLIVAPMAGITDQPYRQLCRQMGAGLTVSEMLSSNPKVWDTEKSQKRMVHSDESGIRAVQIAGSDPELMAEAARYNVANGAQIIDINMGCPAKKVNKKLAGSALLQHPKLVERILKTVVDAVDVPVTLKTRTGWSPEEKNGVEIACLAEANGIQAIAIHGRTRACMYRGNAEYDTIAAIKQSVSIPVIANGDIDSPQKAKQVLASTGADALMIGRAAQGRPWLFKQIAHYLKSNELLPDPPKQEIADIVLAHITALHLFYGEELGPRIARKHVGWYLQTLDHTRVFRSRFNTLITAKDQLSALNAFFALEN
jgi:tRNA-dihydrouridine synthase B